MDQGTGTCRFLSVGDISVQTILVETQGARVGVARGRGGVESKWTLGPSAVVWTS